jgi:KDO2-lipid IV(A) lauroyltransferase
MNAPIEASGRCGIDCVEVARIERLLRETPAGELTGFFTADELRDAGEGAERAVRLAARFAAKEACAKLFPRELALGAISPADFSVRSDAYGAPQAECTPAARAVLDRHRIATIRLSLTHTRESASAVALAEPVRLKVPWYGQGAYHLLPIRRAVVLANMRRVFGQTLDEEEIRRLAQAFYGHFLRLIGEFVVFRFLPRQRRDALVRVENMEAPIRAHARGKGLLLLTCHLGNWEVATVAGIGQFPQYRGMFHFVRRPLKPAWFDRLVTGRFRRAGFGTVSKRGALGQIEQLLQNQQIVVSVFDQHAGRRDGIAVEFFGHPAGTFKSLALLALATGAPVVPAHTWREPDGTHVLRFEEPLPLIECEDTDEAIRRNTRLYNQTVERMILRHPEQWFWFHRRWKLRPQANP